VHNKAKAVIKLFKLSQEHQQSLQEFRDQFKVRRQVWERLGKTWWLRQWYIKGWACPRSGM